MQSAYSNLRGFLVVFAVSLITPILAGFIFKKGRRRNVSACLPILLLLIFSSFVPLIKINGIRYSILNFVLSGSVCFAVMFFGYIIAFLLLLKNNRRLDYLSCAIYFISYIFTWFGVLRRIPESVINQEGSLGILWVIIYLAVPVLNGIAYIFLFTASSSPINKERKRRHFLFF